ncbi:MAG: tetratricopeptide repeat protein [Thermoguttaceae bacterium]
MGRGQSNCGPESSSGNPHYVWPGGPHERPGAERPDGGRDSHLPASGSSLSDRLSLLAVCALLLAVGLVFGQTSGFDFVNYDDDVGVYENRLVTGELTPRSLLAVFTDRHVESTVPLTQISHVLVWHLLGHDAAVHHLTNVLLHAASAVLLLLVLRRMTGHLWPSALVAAIFAIHPLRAESVAWVTERKDVLSGLLFMLTLAAYLRYVRQRFSFARYLAVLACFILSLAAKPMVVTLPFLLLLLDYWPLGRMDGAKPEAPARLSVPIRLILEKTPMLLITCLVCLLAVHGRTAAALAANQQYSLGWRIGNALISYAAYLGQFFCPLGLAPCYPRRPVLPPWQVAAAGLLLVSITAAAPRWRRQRPYLLVGWLWYVGMLVPVIGLVQFGGQAEADRFTYLPQIGLTIGLAWAAADACRTWPRFRPICAIATTSAVLILAVFAWRQTSYWRDSETLWTHTLACTRQNTVAHNNLGIALADRGRTGEAIEHYRKALDVNPDYVEAHNNLGIALADRGRIGEAIKHYRKALEIDPDYAKAYSNLGVALANRGRIGEAIADFQRALDIDPDYADAQANLGNVLARRGRTSEAIVCYERALQLKSDFASAHNGLGNVLSDLGRADEAERHFQEALEIDPKFAEAHNSLGTSLTQRGRVDEAAAEFRRALQLKPDFAEAHDNLGLTLNSLGRTDEAAAEFRRALLLKPDFAEAHGNLGGVLYLQGKLAEAIVHFQKHVELDPKSEMARQNFALAVGRLRGPPAALAHWRWWIDSYPDDAGLLSGAAWQLAAGADASLRNGKEAVELALRAVNLSGKQEPAMLGTLAAAYAEAGRFSQAVKTARRAADLATRQKKTDLAKSIQAKIKLYEARTPYHETGGSN